MTDKILIVEDNLLNMELVLALLERAGRPSIEATSAEVAIEMAQNEQPCLILMDVSLPGMDGLSAVKVLKQNPLTKDIPVVVLTSHAMRGDEAKAVEAGCDGYVTKPIVMTEFMDMLARFKGPAVMEEAQKAEL